MSALSLEHNNNHQSAHEQSEYDEMNHSNPMSSLHTVSPKVNDNEYKKPSNPFKTVRSMSQMLLKSRARRFDTPKLRDILQKSSAFSYLNGAHR